MNEFIGRNEIVGRTALIIGTGGIGRALAEELEQRADFSSVLCIGRQGTPNIDITDEASIGDAANWLQNNDITPEVIIIATGVLHIEGKGPEKSVRELNPEWMLENYRINAVGPALVAKHFLPLMPRNRRTCFAAVSARVGSISDNRLGGWHSYRTSKAALNMLVLNLAIEWQRKNPNSIIVSIHPGTVETRLSAPFQGNPAHPRFAPETAAKQIISTLEGLTPEHSGQLVSYDGTVIAP